MPLNDVCVAKYRCQDLGRGRQAQQVRCRSCYLTGDEFPSEKFQQKYSHFKLGVIFGIMLLNALVSITLLTRI